MINPREPQVVVFFTPTLEVKSFSPMEIKVLSKIPWEASAGMNLNSTLQSQLHVSLSTVQNEGRQTEQEFCSKQQGPSAHLTTESAARVCKHIKHVSGFSNSILT